MSGVRCLIATFFNFPYPSIPAMPVRDAVKCCTVVADGADGLRSGDVVGGIHRYEPLNSQSCKVHVEPHKNHPGTCFSYFIASYAM